MPKGQRKARRHLMMIGRDDQREAWHSDSITLDADSIFGLSFTFGYHASGPNRSTFF